MRYINTEDTQISISEDPAIHPFHQGKRPRASLAFADPVGRKDSLFSSQNEKRDAPLKTATYYYYFIIDTSFYNRMIVPHLENHKSL